MGTSGNSDTTTLALKNTLTYKYSKPLKLSWKLSFLRGESEGKVTSESIDTLLRGDYNLSSKVFVYGNVVWSQNRLAGVRSRITVGPGLGYKVLTGPKHLLNTELGLNYVEETSTDNSSVSTANGRLFAGYTYHFTEQTKAGQDVEYLYDFSNSRNYVVNAETALTTQLTDILSLKTSYVIKYDNEPPLGKEDQDTIMGVTLIATF